MANEHALPNQYVVPCFTNDNNVESYPFQQRISVHNYLSVPIAVATRNGLKFTVEPKPCLFNPRLVVRLEITIDGLIREDVISNLIESSFNQEDTLFFIKTKILQDLESSWHTTTRVSVDFAIQLEQLTSLGGSCYLHDVDLVVSTSCSRKCPDHPSSQEGIKNNITSRAESFNGFYYAVEVVDNLGKYGNRYLYVNNNVYRIVPVKDTNRRDGIYVTSDTPVQGEIQETQKETKHYALSMGVELGLYKTPDEAFNFGDNETKRKQELQDKEHSIQLLKREHQAVALKFEQEINAEKHRSSLLEMQLKDEARRADIAAAKLKDHFDERSYRRKDESEGWKLLPTVIMGIAALFMGIKTFMGSQ